MLGWGGGGGERRRMEGGMLQIEKPAHVLSRDISLNLGHHFLEHLDFSVFK